jgi:protein arginine kinase
MGRFEAFDLAVLNDVFLQTQPAHLQKRQGRDLEDGERDILRAEYIRKRLAC